MSYLYFQTHLCEHRLVHLIVAMATVAHQVHHHILAILLPPLGCNRTHVHHSLRVIRIDMKYWSTHHLVEEGREEVSRWQGGEEVREKAWRRGEQTAGRRHGEEVSTQQGEGMEKR